MTRRPLGRTGISVSEIGIGAWQLGGPLTLDGRADGYPDLGANHAVDLIRRVGDLGVNLIDTAEQYGEGESERRIGLALAGRRGDWIVGTKFGAFRGPHGERIADASAKRLPISLEGSLRRLGTDYIDVYVYHVRPDPAELDAVARFFDDAKRKGQVRAVGISTRDLEQVRLLHGHGLCDVVQFAQSMVEPAADLSAFVAEHRLGAVVRGALAGGRLSGKHFRTPPAFRPDDIRSTWFDAATAARTFAQYRIFEELVRPDRSMVQLAVRFLLDRAATSTVILGARSVAEYAEAIRAVDLPALTPDELRRIERLRARIAHGGPLRRLRSLLRCLRG